MTDGLMGDTNGSASFPLQHEWIVWYNEKPPRGVSFQPDDFEKSILNMGTFSTIEKFWQHFNNLKPEKLPLFSTLRLFKNGIKPIWEDPANFHGGKWVLNTEKEKTADIWGKIVLAAVGNSLDCSDELCGIVLSIRAENDTLQIWNRSADPAVYQKITGELQKTLGLDPSEDLLYQIHAGSMDFNANLRNRNSPGTKRRQGGHSTGNGHHSATNSPSGMTRNNNNTHKNKHHTRGNGYTKSDAAEASHTHVTKEGEGSTSKEGAKEHKKTNGKVEKTTITDSSNESEDDIFKDKGKGALNKSWGDMESDSEGSDSDNIWGSADKKVDWGELAEEDEDEENDGHHHHDHHLQPASPRSDSGRWGDEMEEWDADNDDNPTQDSDGFVCVSRKRRGEGQQERRSVSQDGLHRRKQSGSSLSVPESSSYHKRTNSSETRDNNYNKRGRRSKSNNNTPARGNNNKGGQYKDFSPRDTTGGKLIDYHKRSASSSEQADTPGKGGRKLAMSQDNNRRKSASGGRTMSPAPAAMKPPPGLKGKAWSPIPQSGAGTSWAQVTQGKTIQQQPQTPKLTVTSPAPTAQALSSPPAPIPLTLPDTPSPRTKSPPPATSTPTPTPSATATPTAAETQPASSIPSSKESETKHESASLPPQANEVPCAESQTQPQTQPHNQQQKQAEDSSSAKVETSPLALDSKAIQVEPPKSSTTTESSPPLSTSDKKEETAEVAAKAAFREEEGNEKTKEGEKGESATSLLVIPLPSSDALQVPESPASRNSTPRRKEKRKRKRSLNKKKKEKGNQDLRTHWLLLLTLIVLTCSVFCGIVVVHFIDQAKGK